MAPNDNAWAPKLLRRLSPHHAPHHGNEREPTDDDDHDEGQMSCLAALIENHQREVGLSLFDPTTNTMRLMQYIETGELNAYIAILRLADQGLERVVDVKIPWTNSNFKSAPFPSSLTQAGATASPG